MLAAWKESYYKPRQLIKEQGHYFADKCPYSQSDYFSSSHLWMWELNHKEGWEPNNWCFRLWYQWKLLRVLWTARRSNLSILKEISLKYSLKGLMPKLQYFSYLMWRANSLEKSLILGKIESRRRRGQQKMRWLDGITDSVDVNVSKFWKMVTGRAAQRTTVHRVTKSWAQLSNRIPAIAQL